jgi:uncharacterized membrane protein
MAGRPPSLRESLERVRTWERDHAPAVPRPPTIRTLALRSFEDRLASTITDFAGSMRFVYIHVIWFALWVVLNGGLLLAMELRFTSWDPFPFGLLTLLVSLEAIFLSTFVMIAQNRLSAVADMRAQTDYEVNVRAEAEVAKILALVQSLVEHHVSVEETLAE